MTFTIHAVYDAGTEEVLGFYRSDYHSSIPTPNLVVTEAEHLQALTDQGDGKKLKVTGGALVATLASLPVADVRKRAKRVLDAEASTLIQAVFPVGDAQGFLLLSRVQEAALAVSDGSRTQAEYPLLAAKVLAEGGAVSHGALGVAVTDTETEFGTVRTAVAAIEEIRLEAHKDLDAAADAAAITSVMSAISWPA